MSFKIEFKTSYEIKASALNEIRPHTVCEITEFVPESAPRLATKAEMQPVIDLIKRLALGLMMP